mmetsp:Transcript_11759/g.23393  ORF Transcript_11759/g.23393 Transcript_11759/m.23393 type:complete len:251 (-) Transcript_11759:29-781(-)
MRCVLPLLAALLYSPPTASFAPTFLPVLPKSVQPFSSPVSTHSHRRQTHGLFAGKGFGKEPSTPPQRTPSTPDGSPGEAATPIASSDVTPPQSASAPPSRSSESDSDRQERILREKFGLTSAAERSGSAASASGGVGVDAKQEMRKNLEKAAPNDIFALIPAPVQIFIDRFLKAGVAVSTSLFVLAGVAITAEAWAAASKSPLPANVDSFIVDIVEPNFTPGLLVLLGFSVSLGVFTAAQLGSDSANYRE